MSAAGYHPVHTFREFKDSINVLAFSPNGEHLAAGSDDRYLRIFNINVMLVVRKLCFDSPVNSILWHPQATNTIFVGTGQGAIVIVELGDGEDPPRTTSLPRMTRAPVEHLVYDQERKALTAVIGSEVVLFREPLTRSWSYGTNFPPPPEIAGASSLAVPRCSHPIGRSMAVSYFEHGVVFWALKNMSFERRLVPIRPRIGFSAVTPDKALIAISNLCDGFDLYRLDDHSLVHSFPAFISENVMLPVAFIHSGSILMGGGSGGMVVLWSIKDRSFVGVLGHGQPIMQALAYHESEKMQIATGSAEMGNQTFARLWVREKHVPGIFERYCQQLKGALSRFLCRASLLLIGFAFAAFTAILLATFLRKR